MGLHEILHGKYNIDFASSAEEGLRFVSDNDYELAILDYFIGPLSCIRIAEVLRVRKSDTKICVLTSYIGPETVGSLISIRPEGLLDKTIPVHDLVTAVESIMSGGHFYSPGVVLTLFDLATTQMQESTVLNTNLSAIEKQVLAMTADGLTATEIAERTKSSAAHINNIRRDLKKRFNVDSKAELVAAFHSMSHIL
jgi:DNA-binding NarL/FixJ family response regulator